MHGLNLRELSVAALLNTASGSCTPESADEMRDILAEAGITPVHIWCGNSDDLMDGFAEVAGKNPDVLIVLGGDGTIRTAAEQAKGDGPYLIPLPGGTMNVLPKALYGDRSWQDILRAILANPEEKKVSGGRVGKNRFFVSAICGAPTLWTHVREAIREGELGKAFEHTGEAFGRMFSEKIYYRFNEMNEGETQAISITCPLVSRSLDDDRNVFEAAIIDANDAFDVLGLASAAAFGDWRDHKKVAVMRTPRVEVSADGELPLILDGEAVAADNSIEIVFVPDAFRVLKPADEILS